MSSLFTAAFSRAPSVGKVLFSVTVATNKEWIVWREGVFCHGRALRLIVSVFQWDLRPAILLSRIIALCGKWAFLAERTHSHNTLRASVDFIIFLQQPYKWYKIHKGHFFSPTSPESNTGEMLCCSRGRGGLFSSRFTCFSFSRPTKTDKSPKILEANKQEVPAGGISAVLSPFQLVKQSSWVN